MRTGFNELGWQPVFIHPLLAEGELCRYGVSRADTARLYRLQPWWNHEGQQTADEALSPSDTHGREEQGAEEGGGKGGKK